MCDTLESKAILMLLISLRAVEVLRNCQEVSKNSLVDGALVF
jgi:hypothetical protein